MFAYLSFLSTLLVATIAFAQPTGPPTGPANCTTAKTLLCLAGRASTANDMQISTTSNGTGTIVGATGPGGTLSLRGSTSTLGGIVKLFTSSVNLINPNLSAPVSLNMADADADHGLTLLAPTTMSADPIFTLPGAAPGTSGQPLVSTSAGVWSFVSDTPSDGEVLTWHTGGSVTWDTAGVGADCTTGSTLLCLAGRTTTANDFIISTSGTQGGSIQGSTVAHADLNLNSGTTTVPGSTTIGATIASLNIVDNPGFANLVFPYNGLVGKNTGVTGPIGSNLHPIAFGTNSIVSVVYSTLVENGSEFHTGGLTDFRKFTKPNGSGGFTGGAPGNAQSDMDEYYLARTNAAFNASTGSTMNVRKIRPFIDNIVVSETGTGDFNYLNEYKSFEAIPQFTASVTQGIPYEGLEVKPTISAGAGVSVVGVDILQDADADSMIAYRSNATNYNAANRAFKSTGNAPSTHVGTFRIGDSTVATQPLEVLGNLLIDNSGTAGELRLREPSAGGAQYTAFKAQAQTANITYTWPAADGAGSLTSDGAGNLTWSAAGSGDVTAVGPGCATGACFTNGLATTGTVLLDWEGTTADANDFTINVPADPGAGIAWTVPDAATALTFPSGTRTLATLDGTEVLTNKTASIGGATSEGTGFLNFNVVASGSCGAGEYWVQADSTPTPDVLTICSNGSLITMPGAADTLVGKATTDTLTNKTLDAEGTGNLITLPSTIWLPAASCINATAVENWDTFGTDPVAACVTGTVIKKGVLQFDNTNTCTSTTATTGCVQQHILLPSTWVGNIDATVYFTSTDTTNTDTTKFTIATICRAPAAPGTEDDNPSAFNTAQTLTYTNGASEASATLRKITQTALTTTTCSAGEILHIRVGRDISDSDNTTVNFVGLELTLRKAM